MKKLYILFTLTILFFLSCGNSGNPTTPNNQSPKKLGSLLISISGLTAGLNADINISGPNSYNNHITKDTLLDSLEIGTYTVTTSDVVDTSGDTVQTTTESQTILVEENKIVSVDITYQALSRFYYKIYGRLNLSSVKTSAGATIDGSSFTESNSNSDPGNGSEYTTDGCKLISTDIENGYSKSAAASAGGGSASVDQTLTFTRTTNTVILTTSATVNAPTPGSSNFGIINVDAQSTTYPFVLQFDNPDRDSVEITVSWEATGSASSSGTDISRAGSQVQAVLYIHTSTCFATLFTTAVPFSFSAFEDSFHSNDNMPVSGQSSVTFNSTFYLVGFDLMTRSIAGSYQQAIGNSGDGSGSSSGSLSVTITVVVRRF